MESVFIFHSCIRLNYCWFVNVNEGPSLYFQLCRGDCFSMVVIVNFLLLYTIQFLLVLIFSTLLWGLFPNDKSVFIFTLVYGSILVGS